MLTCRICWSLGQRQPEVAYSRRPHQVGGIRRSSRGILAFSSLSLVCLPAPIMVPFVLRRRTD